MFDTVSICLSKGLAAPAGSIVVGDVETIRKLTTKEDGRRGDAPSRYTAAGASCPSNNIERLADDHRRANELSIAVSQLATIKLVEKPQTNMVMLKMSRINSKH